MKQEIQDKKPVELKNVKIDGQSYFKITNHDEMRPFFMSIVSDANHWLFVSSNGGITAGRKNSEYALFPYYTDDKITESVEVTGSKSIFAIETKEGRKTWEPFSIRNEGLYKITRNLYKNTFGNKVIFEEENHDLNLTYSYQWSSSNTYGFVKTSKLINTSASEQKVSVLDGLQNILPFGVPSETQMRVSNLVDAYKRSELVEEAGLGIFALSAIIVDKAEPSEALKANVAWSLGLDHVKYLLSSKQVADFRQGKAITQETDIKAEKGAYFINTEMSLQPNAEKEWMIIGNVNQNHSAIAALVQDIKSNKQLAANVRSDIEKGTENLYKLNAGADALQLTADKLRDTRHFANTLFNIMRGGIFDHNYQIEKWDFKNYISKANQEVYSNVSDVLNDLPETFDLSKLKGMAGSSDDMDFKRLCLEYMPLKFSRRHGDPSRPWNKFSINTTNEEDGSKILDYEGNWRDIFQNWEALAHAYPEFIESMIHKFLNASTFDGYNPYRVTKEGFDWEIIEPDDPWSYIGYWGDHQIIYLLKFLEFIESHEPGKLESYFNRSLFVYANVPYRIKPYQEILKNPKDTIDFDMDAQEQIEADRLKLGADGALLKSKENTIYKVNFIEKLLATVLAKLSNFIPEAGIWLNTQRPEWNDANNALVGNGVSMVTLYYLRRFLHYFEGILAKADVQEVHISEELLIFFNGVYAAFKNHESLLNAAFNDTQRKAVLDQLGASASDYRMAIYKDGFSGKKQSLKLDELSALVMISLKYLEHSIDANQREDKLYHAYNLMTVESEQSISISHLEEMLEGQVAALSSGYLDSKTCLDVLDAMKSSKLFREDQYSYLLYPNKGLPGFMVKNTIPKEAVDQSQLIKKLDEKGNTSIVEKDVNGDFHFNGNFNNADSLKKALSKLKSTEFKELAEQETQLLLTTFEKVFNHKAFTGRSGTFYGYEGLGSIYWHMVSKLQYAVQEVCLRAIREKQSDAVVGSLLEHYYEINEGIGVHKSPELYGAFPTDPYSHTPAGKGAQQPGMTGQVKEDILSRIGELGVFVNEGKLNFNPCLLRTNEFLTSSRVYSYIDVAQNTNEIKLNAHMLAFTYCQVPIIYHLGNKIGIELVLVDGASKTYDSLSLDEVMSSHIFKRNHKVKQVNVYVTEGICN
ncbi:hypothetical protein ESY86_16025 [Subsaximicrobium wynnwilliamsii]|uniref:Cellobiose phosphorylase n=1 Tax=Subsaximicrobium wynnwilliamsii TaxID=291179 RepID=A0A5C6ZDV1_9FLAO|nr:hypothetical protein [Subsaximicrobium wynnwilliamsii]TXD81966.1 hypothetical protein ESY87_16005 [Subsaximicrobium wynnwilliamsii]TXD87664.1 hypothetical protein ESY86_16025 [Subsaximicrobium wynnwilliamsii]TXE01411.1 hypothetical protein ESY88_15995 [Subsaximicrobium wynnwilliamsii]